MANKANIAKGLPQASFSSGEITPLMYGRIDFEKYYSGLRTCRNFIITKYGGADNRPGTQFVSAVDDSDQPHRIIPFQFNNQQQYVLVLGDKTMQIVANGALITSETPYPITGLTAHYNSFYRSYNITLTIPGHPFSTNEMVFITGVSSAINGARPITKIDANTIALIGGFPFTVWSGGGTVQAGTGTSLTVTTPWAASDLFMLKFTQSADVLTVTHPNYPPYQIERLAENNWVIVPFANVNGPFQDINIDETILVWADGVIGTVGLTSSKALFTADMIGLPFYIQSPPVDNTSVWQVAQAATAGKIVIWGMNYYVAANTGTTGTTPPTHTDGSQMDGFNGVLWTYLHSGFGIVTITAVASSTSATGKVTTRLPDTVVGGTLTYTITRIGATSGTNVADQLQISAPANLQVGNMITISGASDPELNAVWQITGVGNSTNYTFNHYGSAISSSAALSIQNSTYRWALPAWGLAVQGNPGTTCYFQDRQLFGGSNGQPSTWWASRTDGFLDFGVENPVLDDDAITYKILSYRTNIIKHFLNLQYLLILTTSGIWMVQSGKSGENILTGTGTLDLSWQGDTPACDIPPLKINNFGLFISDLGNEVRTLGYSFAENAFVGTDLTIMSHHLLQFNKIIDWTYQRNPYSCVWAIRDDGILLGCTFFPEQQINAWHHHDTQGTFESVCCIIENNANVVYLIVNRTLNGSIVRCIERMAPRQFQDQIDAFFLDCALTYDGRPGTTATVFTGAEHLAGMTVSVHADGIVLPSFVMPSNGQFTLANPALVVHVGLAYTSDFETLDISSMRADIRDKKKDINSVSIIVDQSSGFLTGPDADHLVPYKQQRATNYGSPDALLSQVVDITIFCSWEKTGRIFVRQAQPLPLSILAVIPQLTLGGN